MADTAGDRGHHSSGSKGEDCQSSLLIKLRPYLGPEETVGPLTLYKLSTEDGGQEAVWKIGRETSDKQNKVIMLVGETGSGKTTLLNTMINYILGVEWKDGHRFRLISESSGKSQAHSQTMKVTTYQFYHEEEFRIPYSITIIDTPGFGDTRGLKWDKNIMQQIRHFFCQDQISAIDAIGFVVKSSSARLSPTQKYIFDNILSIFGKDIKDNIVFFTTFAESTKPVVLSAITEANVPCARSEEGLPVHFKVNNCMLYADNRPDEEDGGCACMMDEAQWKMGMNSLGKFMVNVLPQLKSKSLILTKDVLEETIALEATLDGLMGRLDDIMIKQHELEKTEKELKEHWEDLEKGFEFEIKETVMEKKTSDWMSINCKDGYTCYQEVGALLSTIILIVQKLFWGVCVMCNKDLIHEHTRDYYYWGSAVVTKKRSSQELKEKYGKEDEKVMNYDDVLKKLKDEMEKSEKEVERLIKEALKSIKRLQDIALNPSPLSALDYIDLLTDKEKREGKSGYLERIEMLEKTRRNVQKQQATQE